MNKIIFLTSQNLSSWNYKRFGLSILMKNFNIQYCNVGYLHSNKSLEDEDHQTSKLIRIYTFKKYMDLFRFCVNLNKNEYIIDLSSNNDFLYLVIKKFMHLKGLKEIKIFLGDYVETKTSIKKRIFILLKKIRHKYLFRSYLSTIKTLILKKIINLKYYHYFYSGAVDQGNKNFTFSHCIDYNQYLELRESRDEEPLKKYIVFLDQAYTEHPEFEFVKTPSFIDNNYYDKLQIFFKKLSTYYNREVIFCAHPRTNKNSLYLKKFKNVKFDKSAYYTMNADIVVAHDSISLNFPILFYKPILLVKIDGMELSNKKNNLKFTSELLGCGMIDINEYNFDQNLIKNKVDVKKYNDYIKKYIKFAGKEKNSWEIVSEKLLDLQKQ